MRERSSGRPADSTEQKRAPSGHDSGHDNAVACARGCRRSGQPSTSGQIHKFQVGGDRFVSAGPIAHCPVNPGRYTLHSVPSLMVWRRPYSRRYAAAYAMAQQRSAGRCYGCLDLLPAAGSLRQDNEAVWARPLTGLSSMCPHCRYPSTTL